MIATTLYVLAWIAIGVLAEYAGHIKGHTKRFNKESVTVFGTLATILTILTFVIL